MRPTLGFGRGLARLARVFSGRGPGARRGPLAKARRRLAPEVSPLEDRLLQYFSVDVTITPRVLWPPDGRFVPVTISGTLREFSLAGSGAKARPIFQEVPGPKKAVFEVVDEYRRDEPFDEIPLVNEGGGKYTFSVTTHLQAQRSTRFVAGRRYYVTVAVHDRDGWFFKELPVQVPAQLGHPGPGPIPDLSSKVPGKPKPVVTTQKPSSSHSIFPHF